jgi:glycosyltransferase involved in cell wall biosynthesis
MSVPAARIPVTAMVFTLDEELNLPACLESLGAFEDVVVVDSFSTDRTEAIAREAGARFVQHAFEGFGSQRAWAFANAGVGSAWVLVLDADERVPPELAAEIDREVRAAPEAVAAFRLRRRFYLWGRWLRHSSLYPTWVVRLVRPRRVEWVDRGHAETQRVFGEIRELASDLIDENRKGVAEWFARQARYAAKEADYELTLEGAAAGVSGLFSGDPLRRREALKALGRRLPGRSLWFFLYCALVRGGFLDGVAGLRFCAMKAVYQYQVGAIKRELRRGGRA